MSSLFSVSRTKSGIIGAIISSVAVQVGAVYTVTCNSVPGPVWSEKSIKEWNQDPMLGLSFEYDDDEGKCTTVDHPRTTVTCKLVEDQGDVDDEFSFKLLEHLLTECEKS
jgi:hypothetical protein